MLFFWILLFIATFLGTIALVFYMTIELNELEKKMAELLERIKKRYGTYEEKKL